MAFVYKARRSAGKTLSARAVSATLPHDPGALKIHAPWHHHELGMHYLLSNQPVGTVTVNLGDLCIELSAKEAQTIGRMAEDRIRPMLAGDLDWRT